MWDTRSEYTEHTFYLIKDVIFGIEVRVFVLLSFQEIYFWKSSFASESISEITCRDWFRRIKDNDFNVKDKEHAGQPEKLEDRESVALLEEDPCQMLKQLSETLHVNESTPSKRLKAITIIQKGGNWHTLNCGKETLRNV